LATRSITFTSEETEHGIIPGFLRITILLFPAEIAEIAEILAAHEVAAIFPWEK
jgi:hypothetical protein